MFIEISQRYFRKFLTLIIILIIVNLHLFTFDKKMFSRNLEKKAN